MTVLTMKSEEARVRFRDILDDVYAGQSSVVVERYNKPTAVIINYTQWQQWQAWTQRMLKIVERARKEMDAGNYLTQEEVDAGLRERGLL